MSATSTKKVTKTLSARGLKAREKLKQAASAVLERKGFHQMKVADITREAGVAAGLFYHYFSDTKSLTLEVLTDFLSRFEALDEIEKDVVEGDWYSRIYAHTKVFVESYATHPGLMRCLLQLSDQEPEFRALYKKCTMRQMLWLSNLTPEMFPESTITKDEALLMIYSISGTTESLLQEYYIAQDPDLCSKKVTVEEMSELTATMFYRALFLKQPPHQNTDIAKKLSRIDGDHFKRVNIN